MSDDTKRRVNSPGRRRLGTLKEEDPQPGSGLSASRTQQRPDANGSALRPPQSHANGSCSAPSAAHPGPTRKHQFKPKAPGARKRSEASEAEKHAAGQQDVNDLVLAAQAHKARLAEQERARLAHQQRGQNSATPRLAHGAVSALGPSGPQGRPSGGGVPGSRTQGDTARRRFQTQRQMQEGQVKLESAQRDTCKSELEQSYPMDIDEHGPPFNYAAFYPTMLPMRPPEMEHMDDAGASADNAAVELQGHVIDEDAPGPTAAEALGLWPDTGGPQRLMLMQLPDVLPRQCQPPSGAPPGSKLPGSSLQQLGNGQIGKLLVCESGAVKLRMGDVLLDVAPGAASQCRQELAVVSSKEATMTVLGCVTHSAVCTPDLEHLFGDGRFPEWPRAAGLHRPDTQTDNDGPEVKAEVKPEPGDQ